jgi:hypothetical protein
MTDGIDKIQLVVQTRSYDEVQREVAGAVRTEVLGLIAGLVGTLTEDGAEKLMPGLRVAWSIAAGDSGDGIQYALREATRHDGPALRRLLLMLADRLPKADISEPLDGPVISRVEGPGSVRLAAQLGHDVVVDGDDQVSPCARCGYGWMVAQFLPCGPQSDMRPMVDRAVFDAGKKGHSASPSYLCQRCEVPILSGAARSVACSG